MESYAWLVKEEVTTAAQSGVRSRRGERKRPGNWIPPTGGMKQFIGDATVRAMGSGKNTQVS